MRYDRLIQVVTRLSVSRPHFYKSMSSYFLSASTVPQTQLHLTNKHIETPRHVCESTIMSYWAGWTPDEEIVLVWFLSCGIKKSAVSKLIAHKCGTAQHDEQDMTHHSFELHKDSKRDTWEGFGPLLAPKSKGPTPHARVPDAWAIDWKDSWREYNVDDWLIQKT